MDIRALPTPRRTLVVTGTLLAVAFTLAACGGSSSSPSPSSSTAAAGRARAGGGFAGGGTDAGFPGATGQVAAISGTTMQVQNPQSGQVAVKWTSSTTFSHPVTVALSAVRPGDCVVATASSSSSSSSFTATAVTVSSPVNGQCTGPGGGPRPGGFPAGHRPSDFPSGASHRPGAGRGGGPPNGGFVAGTVSSVSGRSIVVAARQFGSGSTTNRTVSLTQQTKITKQKATTPSALKAGLCVAAQGNADSTGTVTATRVRITDPVNGQCTLGLGGGRNG